MRRILPILSFILLIATQSQGQSSPVSSLPESADRIIKLYPNPATTNITFDLQKDFSRGMSIQIYSFLGKKMQDIPNASQKTTIDLSAFNRGIYMYHLLDPAGRVVESGKFRVTK